MTERDSHHRIERWNYAIPMAVGLCLLSLYAAIRLQEMYFSGWFDGQKWVAFFIGICIMFLGLNSAAYIAVAPWKREVDN